MTEEEKYIGLRWYLPPYFKDSLAKCRFEQGTVIYKDKPIGENWGDNIKHIDFLIQIQFPPSTMTTGSGDEGEIAANWETDVIVDCYYPKTREKKSIKTTQGRLFTFLWKDNLEYLHGADPLLPPLFVSNKPINERFISDKIPNGNVGFAFVYNPINDIQRSKLSEIKKISSNLEELDFAIEESCERMKIEIELKEKIEKKIRKELEEEIRKVTEKKTDKEIAQELEKRSNEIGKKVEVEFEKRRNSEIYPLQKVKLLLFENANYDDTYELIKKAVYKPQKDAKKDMFNIRVHGLLIENR